MLTRRGWAVAAVAGGALLLGAQFGARSLDAVAGPALVALAAAYVQLRRAPQPELRTRTPEYGFAGETATVSLDFDASAPVAATVRFRADDGLAIPDSEIETTVTDGSLAFAVELRERGVRSVGPVEVVAEDVFGLWRTTYRYPVRRDLVVFPEIHRLRDATELAALRREFGLGGRDRFDQLREYERGDPLRDVHWKTSAKRADADLVVMEFEADERREQVELLAEADGGRADDVAEAAASVAAYLLEAGLAVGLTTPSGRVEPGVGPDHRTEILGHLARLSAGTVGDPRRDDADVAVRGPADADAVRITVGDRTVTFAQLTGGSVGTNETVASGSNHQSASADAGASAFADGGSVGRRIGDRGGGSR
ncbi:DUF58 domain-containing protein [Halorussus amylolyticus]|uniref:DUF58 domain-containing protein n=1 Tax=Halorussus amylolyticus TaxID=1126242 RepID=UPI0010540F96|nr:DUF58 domain-containing protein [Halorussus amylolyticus]